MDRSRPALRWTPPAVWFVLAAICTYYTPRGSIRGKPVAWVGDANNMSYTWIQAARLLDAA